MLLTKNRTSQVKEKYNIPTEVWENMLNGSNAIAKNQKYLEWIAKIWTKEVSEQGYDVSNPVPQDILNNILTTVEEFDRLRANLNKKDLYQYRNVSEVVATIKDYRLENTRNVETHKESEVVFEDSMYKVVVPESHTASCYYGAGTKWCTAAKNNDNHFKSYNKDGKLFYIISKNAPTSNDYYKVALNKTYKGSSTFYDAKDKPIPDTKNISDIMSHPKVMSTINEFFKFSYAEEIAKISEEEKQREIERISRDAEWARRRREREQRLEQEANERRDNDEWKEGESGDVGIMARALMNFIKSEGEFNDNRQEIQAVRDEIEDLRQGMENDPEVIADPNGERAQDFGMDLNNLEEEIVDLQDTGDDIYDIKYEDIQHYGLEEFSYNGADYAVGDDSMSDNAAYEQVKSLIEDIGYDGFTPGFYEWYIDGDEVGRYFEDFFWDDVRSEPENHLDEDDRTLTDEAVSLIEDLEDEITDLKDELAFLEDEGQREDLELSIDEITENIENISEDEDYLEWSEETMEEYVTNKVSDVVDSPVEWLRDYGMEDSISDFINEEDFIEGVIQSDGRGNGLAGYDGIENEQVEDGEWYYIYRTN